jgi:hypothetical protein
MSKNKKVLEFKTLEHTTKEEQHLMWLATNYVGKEGSTVKSWSKIESLDDTVTEGCENDKEGYDWQDDRKITFELSDWNLLTKQINLCVFKDNYYSKKSKGLLDRMDKVEVFIPTVEEPPSSEPNT